MNTVIREAGRHRGYIGEIGLHPRQTDPAGLAEVGTTRGVAESAPLSTRPLVNNHHRASPSCAGGTRSATSTPAPRSALTAIRSSNATHSSDARSLRTPIAAAASLNAFALSSLRIAASWEW